MNKEYEMAVALLQFKNAYSRLTKASIPMEDLDLSESYPFFLLDFEEIAPAVAQWCTIHANRLMRNLPDRVDNPACLQCMYYRAGIGSDGVCIGLDKVKCFIHPFVAFSVAAVAPYFRSVGVDISKMTDDEVHLLYMKRTDEIYANKTTK